MFVPTGVRKKKKRRRGEKGIVKRISKSRKKPVESRLLRHANQQRQ